MHRIIKCDKDSYITNKIIGGARRTGANVGQASSIDLYKLYNESTLSGSTYPVEQTRALLHFNLDPLRELTGSVLNYSTGSFKAFLSLKNIYGGEYQPSNFVLTLYPLAKTFSEGRGKDVRTYMEKDATNWLTASVIGSSNTPTLWEMSGANKSGLLGSTDIDYYSSGNLGSGVVPLSSSYTFLLGNEDMYMDVTSLISGTLAGLIPDYGFRLSFTASMDNDTVTYGVKRFSSRHVRNSFNRPTLHVYYNDSFVDKSSELYFGLSNTVTIYNKALGTFKNFISGATELTGANCVSLELISSRSLTVWTSSFSTTHNTTINHLTRSWYYFSTSFTGSQISINGFYQSGAYSSNITLDQYSTYLSTYLNYTDWQGLGKQTELQVVPVWKTLAGFFLTSGSALTIKPYVGSNSYVYDNPYVVNISNLKSEYNEQEKVRLRVVVYSNYTNLKTYKFNNEMNSVIFENVYWRLIHSYTKREIIPFDDVYNSTKLSSDGKGMYFDFWMPDLDPNQVYEFEFMIKEDGKTHVYQNQGFIFKVTE